MDILSYFTSLPGAAALTVIISGYIFTHLLTTLSKIWKQVTTWVVGAIVIIAANYFSLGVFVNLDLLHIILNGIAVGLLANGIFTYDLIQAILEIIGARKKGLPKAG